MSAKQSAKPTRKNFFERLKQSKYRRLWPLLVVFAYLFFTLYYVKPIITNCTGTLTGIGDNTAGPIWRFGQASQSPLGSFENATNYPKGETLYSPINYSLSLQSTALWGLSKTVGSVCGYNLFNILGYMTTALVMFGFIYYLTRNRWIALLGGYAVAFSPYIQGKIGGHPSYGYASLLIGTLWLAMQLMKKQRLRYAVGLAVIFAACMYFDPYFILLSGTILGPFIAVIALGAAWNYIKKPKSRPNITRIFKYYLLSFGIFVVLFSPLLAIRVIKASSIDFVTSSTRGDVFAAAQMCSNLPQDYLLPDPQNMHLISLLGRSYEKENIKIRNWCGYGESRVSISLALLAVLSLGLIILLWEKLNKRSLQLNKVLYYDSRLLIATLVAVALAAFLLGLPPKIGGIITPSGIVLHLTTTWRIFAREYLVLNIAIVALAAICMVYFYRILGGFHRYIPRVLFVLLFLAIFCEYQIQPGFEPFNFNYKRDVPKVYQNLRDDASVKAIAEYPIDRAGIEADSIVYYLTMQSIHKKPILNDATPSSSGVIMHIGLKDLTDPQTVPALRTLGIDTVVVHGVAPDKLVNTVKPLGLTFIAHEVPPVFNVNLINGNVGTTDTVVLKLGEGPKADRVVAPSKGFVINWPIMKNSIDLEYEIIQDTQLTVFGLADSARTSQPVCFEVKTADAADHDLLTLTLNGQQVQAQSITGSYQKFTVSAKATDVIKLHNASGHNMRLNNLGCRQGQ